MELFAQSVLKYTYSYNIVIFSIYQQLVFLATLSK